MRIRFPFVIFCFIFILLSESLLHAHEPRKKVALVLSGGGAKGFAHIGVLKVLEKAGIPIDIVTGTSMGGIVGGLYSIGYNSGQLDSLARVQDWAFILSDNDNLQSQSVEARRKANTYIINSSILSQSVKLSMPAGIIKGKNLAILFRNLTEGYNDSIDFNSLPRRFACVSTDIVTNTEYDFHSGILAEAMRSSMSIPAVFSPLRKGDMILVDGGLRNNYPADLAKEMGADIIIGVTVQGAPKTADDLSGAMSLIGQIVDINCKLKYDENLSITDIPIRVNTKPFNIASFTKEAVDSLIKRGEEEALKHWDELMALKDSLGLNNGNIDIYIANKSLESVDRNVKVNHFFFSSMSKHDERFLRAKFHLLDGGYINRITAEGVINSLSNDLFYENTSYRYDKTTDGSYVLTFQAEKIKTAKVNVAARFDSEEMASVQVNTELPFHTSSPFNFDFTLRLGKRIKSRLEVVFYPISITKMKLAYEYDNIDINVYENGNREYNNIFGNHSVDLTLIDFNVKNFNVAIYSKWNYYHHGDMLTVRKSDNYNNTLAINNEHFYSYHLNTRYDSQDDWNFPTRGVYMNTGYGYYTDNFVGYKGGVGYSVIDASWRMSISASNTLSIQPMLYGRLILGKSIPHIMKNMVGGDFFGHYMSQQMPFTGIGNVEVVDNLFSAMQVSAQQRIFSNIYILGKMSIAQYCDKLNNFFDGNTIWGMQIGGYYKSLFGPLGANIGWSNLTNKPYLYINLGFQF